MRALRTKGLEKLVLRALNLLVRGGGMHAGGGEREGRLAVSKGLLRIIWMGWMKYL